MKGQKETAHKLVLELRKEYKVEAYVHRKHYDFTQNIGGLGVDKYGAAKKMRYLKTRQFDEIAVLVGNFPTVDDPAVEKTLNKLKYSQPKTLQNLDYTPQRFGTYRAAQRAIKRSISRDKNAAHKGPLGNSFVTRNPLIPKEFFSPGGLDKTVQNMNKDVLHSLLDCPKKYTVRVAAFRGNVVLDQKVIHDIERGQEMESSLDKAALKAHKLTEALRKQGFRSLRIS